MELPATDPYQAAPDGVWRSAFGALGERTDLSDVGAVADGLLAELSLDERLGLLCGDDPLLRGSLEMAKRYVGEPCVAGAVPRLGLPGIRFTDGPRGVVMYRSTAFPSPMARGATFDLVLEERVGDAIGVESRAQGANLFAGVCINLLRHPAWGRSQETYGEDPFLLGEMGAALTRGVQRHVMACVKHYALNSMENSRFWVDVQVDERDLRDVYLPHFQRVVDEGVASVMSAYNKVNGQWCGHHRHLLRDLLKGDWGFEGFVMSDFTFGIRGARPAIEGGMDLEMPQRGWFRFLPGLVRRGRVRRERIDDAARRLVSTQVRFASIGEPERYDLAAVAGPEHRALAEEVCARSLVLLRNDLWDEVPVLPFIPERVRSIAVIGPLADVVNLGDHGSSRVRPPAATTVLEGLRALGEEVGVVVHHDPGNDPDQAALLADRCDAAVVVVGTTYREEGEWVLRDGGDRSSLRLPTVQEELVRAVGAANRRTAVVLMGGSVVITDRFDAVAPAQVMAWYPGMEGGSAIAKLLLGEAEPEGRLPLTWPSGSTRLPPFRRFTRRITYGPLHGYRMMEATAQRPAHWFGHGLSYTTFTWSDAAIEQIEERGGGARRVVAAVSIENTGDRPGTEVVQAYAPLVLGSHPAPLRTLRGSTVARAIQPGELRRVVSEIVVPAHADELHLGPSADPDLAIVLRLPPRGGDL
jgi:beta-glucosidase